MKLAILIVFAFAVVSIASLPLQEDPASPGANQIGSDYFQQVSA